MKSRWKSLEYMLTLYFCYRNDWPISSVLGKSGFSDTANVNSVPLLYQVFGDLGAALGRLSVDQHDAIYTVFELNLVRDDHHTAQTMCSREANVAERREDFAAKKRHLRQSHLEGIWAEKAGKEINKRRHRKNFMTGMNEVEEHLLACEFYEGIKELEKELKERCT